MKISLLLLWTFGIKTNALILLPKVKKEAIKMLITYKSLDEYL